MNSVPYFIVLVAAVSLITTGCQNCFHPALSTGRQLYVMLGDSQSVGQGDMEPEASDPHVYLYTWAGKWRIATEPTSDTTGTSLAMSYGYSCGLSFAKSLRSFQPAQEIGLIPCGHNGSTLTRWMNDGANSGEGPFYSTCRERVQEAKKSGQIAGIIIHLGTNDGMDVFDSDAKGGWSQDFPNFVNRLHADIGNVPIIFAQIGQTTSPNAIYWQDIKDEQRGVNIPNVKMITTDDLSLKGDGIHLDTMGLRTLGQRYAAAFYGMANDGGNGGACSDPWYRRLLPH